MNWEPQRPGYSLRWILPPLLALASGFGAWYWLSLPRPSSSENSLEALQKSLGWWERLLDILRSPIGSIVTASVVALVLMILSSWFCLQLKLRRELFLSFYREEIVQRLRRFG